MRYHLCQDSFWKVVKTAKTSDSKDCRKISFGHHCTSRGQAWTFHWPPTYVHVDIHVPTLPIYFKIQRTANIRILILFNIVSSNKAVPQIFLQIALYFYMETTIVFCSKLFPPNSCFLQHIQFILNFVHVDIYKTTHPPDVDNHGH